MYKDFFLVYDGNYIVKGYKRKPFTLTCCLVSRLLKVKNKRARISSLAGDLPLCLRRGGL